MATESVAARGSEQAVWLRDNSVLTFYLDRQTNGFPPALKQCEALNLTIQGLARAAKSVIYHAENSEQCDFLMQPIEDIADAILLLSQLSNAVQDEATREEGVRS